MARCSYVDYSLRIQVGALSVVEAKKRFELLEAVGSAMDAHLHYFKQVFGFKNNILLKFFLKFYCIRYLSDVQYPGLWAIASNGALH